MSPTIYNPDGPLVILANPTSIFPQHMAAVWRAAGRDAALATCWPHGMQTLPCGASVIDSSAFRSEQAKRWWERWGPRLRPWEWRLAKLSLGHFRRATGRRYPADWERTFLDNLWDALPTARAALAARPRAVFGHELTSYGFATSLCRGVPRLLFPWGGDVFISAETSLVQYAIIRHSLHSADLILPASATAANHIHHRFRVPRTKIESVSWGVDRQMFQRATPPQRAAICSQWGIKPDSLIVLNARRFSPNWGALTALDAFLRLAAEDPRLHFVCLGGLDTEPYVAPARAKVAAAGFASRFTFFDGDMPLALCAQMMSIADVFTSLLGRGDMRSGSVLQAAAAGGMPVVRATPEYRYLAHLGFSAILLDGDSIDELLQALRKACSDPDLRALMREQNRRYVETHEDSHRQMARLMELVDGACQRFEARNKTVLNGCVSREVKSGRLTCWPTSFDRIRKVA